jgi:hypothetical protein
MDRYAVLVDAGYLLAGGADAVLGVERPNASTKYDDLLNWLASECEVTFPGRDLLRIYWYDASPQLLPNAEQISVAEQPDTKLRLGHLTPYGQKGVDALLLSDLTELGRNRVVSDVVLVAGDGDHVLAVEQAQALGIRVAVWGVETREPSMSHELRRAADRQRLLTPDELKPFFAKSIPPPSVRPAWLDAAATVEQRDTRRPALPTYSVVHPDDARESGARFAAQFLKTARPDDLLAVHAAQRPSVPQGVDGRLLYFTVEDLGLPEGAQLSHEARIAARDGFWQGFDETDRA